MDLGKQGREPSASREQSPNDFFDPSKPQVRRSMVFFALGALLGLAVAGYGLFTA